ncbi:MAG: PKD domain-containing protein [Pirellulaceae bacterium]
MKLQAVVISILTLAPLFAEAQRHAWQDELLPYRRQVSVKPRAQEVPPIVTTRFFTHGAVDADSAAVAVYARREQVPSRVLQIGPGDLLRVAFETRKSEIRYHIYYGGAAATTPSPDWTATGGLFLETRSWKSCDLSQLDSVRQAFESAQRLGSDYVQHVFHRYNPFGVEPGPFLSHYTGTIRISRPGRYAFFTSSQDCSFLLIDGKEVVAAPGRHGPARRAKTKGEIELSGGAHPFDYWHAASGKETCAVAAWREPGAEKPTPIPPDAFGWNRISRLPAEQPEHEKDGPLPDYQMTIAGEASIEGSKQWAVRVQFDGTGPGGSRSGACTWEFGDGQTSERWQPTHIYLHPGEYSVTLNARQRGKVRRVTNRVHVTRFQQRQDVKNADEMDDYLAIIETYDVTKLDAESVLQLVRLRRSRSEWRAALDRGMRALTGGDMSGSDSTRWEIAELLGPIASRRLHDPSASLKLWKAAGNSIQDAEYRIRCALAAADVALNELLESDEARPFLEFARDRLRDDSSQQAATLHRLWGDWHARNGDPDAALDAYKKASAARNLDLNVIRKNASRGAFSRSTEAFLQDDDLVRAAEQLEKWQRDFPLDKTKGYFSTLLARYWLKRNRPRVAIAVTEDLLTISPQSPYADRLLIVQATAAEALERIDRAISAYQSLLTDYPGSPHARNAKEGISRLRSRLEDE